MPLSAQRMLPPTLAQRLEHCTSLPSLPAIVLKVIELARTPSTGSQNLADTLAQDPSLCAKILSVANSSFYGGHPLKSILQAVNRIGVEGALSLALSFGLVRSGYATHNGMDLDSFWKRALLSGLAVRELKKTLRQPFDVETVYIAAVMQDIGMLALNEIDADIYGVIFHSARSHRQLASFEEREFQTQHAQVGAWLGARWGLPSLYTRLIEQSHALPKEIDKKDINLRVLALSGLLADTWLSSNREIAMTLAFQASQDYLQLDEQSFAHLLLRLQEALPELARLFQVKAPEKLDTFQLLQDAKSILVERNLKMIQKVAQQQQELDALRRQSQQLQEQLKRDPLTGIFNRQYIDRLLNEYFKRVEQGQEHALAVIFIDLDYFKTLNDQYGHALGDSALKAFASLLEQEVPRGASVGRYGGEEFLVLMPSVHLDVATQFARHLQNYLATTPLLSHQQQDLYISASMGIAFHTLASHARFEDAEALINTADQTMYQAKRSGRNRILIFRGDRIDDLSDR
ncbi:diguanylate cyclase [Marinospirillum sp. MEB164]|uniref:diguanylate cyclase n=1 Tax=Marinospirillum alkalitolerans TaxID=3123374 RepID=A0ABW8PY92_9GAMM